jgi:hypothetical protein
VSRPIISQAEFASLPDDALLPVREIATTKSRRGPIPFSRSKLWAMVKAGDFPPGRTIGTTRYWTAGEVRAFLAKATEEGWAA